jgi:transcription termination factor Rho
MIFKDRQLELFGRLPDVARLTERARTKGFTAVVARPTMGKTWLLTEVARQLTTAKPNAFVGVR